MYRPRVANLTETVTIQIIKTILFAYMETRRCISKSLNKLLSIESVSEDVLEGSRSTES